MNRRFAHLLAGLVLALFLLPAAGRAQEAQYSFIGTWVLDSSHTYTRAGASPEVVKAFDSIPARERLRIVFRPDHTYQICANRRFAGAEESQGTWELLEDNRTILLKKANSPIRYKVMVVSSTEYTLIVRFKGSYNNTSFVFGRPAGE